MFFTRSKFLGLCLAIVVLASCQPMLQKPGEMVLGKGVIKVLDDKRLLIQETTSVIALDMDQTSARYLSSRYNAGQNITILGTKIIDKDGNSRETITAVVFADGTRFNIVS